eukprot:9495587-Pyramimonas_sp.AAC.1
MGAPHRLKRRADFRGLPTSHPFPGPPFQAALGEQTWGGPYPWAQIQSGQGQEGRGRASR